MRLFYALIFLSFFFSTLKSQNFIQGVVTDEKGFPLIGANLYIKGSYNGTITDTTGYFQLSISGNSTNELVCSYLGYDDAILRLDAESPASNVKIRLKEKVNAMSGVVITAGNFGAADSKKAVILKPYDVLTTASALGDVYGALQSLPGTSLVGEEGGLYVRGGEGFETRTFIDGMLVHRPYTSRMPDLPARGRFNPALFQGILFSTGGFSAEYGQALSSALILNTPGVAEENSTSLSLLPFGGGFSHTDHYGGGSFSGGVEYFNMKPYMAVIEQDINWEKAPVNGSANIIWKQKIASEGVIRGFFAGNLSESVLKMAEPGKDLLTRYRLQNQDGYANMVYTRPLYSGWKLKTGISYTSDLEKIYPGDDRVKIQESAIQWKAVSWKEEGNFTTRMGLQTDGILYSLSYLQGTTGFKAQPEFENFLAAGFAETEWKIKNILSIRAGGRMEYSASNQDFVLSPRISSGWKVSENSQISAAWGYYSQIPEASLLMYNTKLKNQRARHAVLNYQWVAGSRTFRTEIFNKKYEHLVRYDSLHAPLASSYSSVGYGFARGVDLFWRDKKSIPNGDYWISYSWLSTKRLHRDFPVAARPSYFPRHSLSAVYKQFFIKYRSQLSLSFQATSGRPYHNPNLSGFMQSRTPVYSNLNLSYSYILIRNRNLFVFHSTLTNVLGSKQIFGYRYSALPDEEGVYASKALRPAADRMILAGIFINFNYQINP